VEILICVEGVQQGQRFPIEDNDFTLGRERYNKIQIDDDGASRKHSQILRKGDILYLKDLNSTNGTYLNNQKVTIAPIANGDRIGIGNTTFLVQIKREQAEEKVVSFVHSPLEGITSEFKLDAASRLLDPTSEIVTGTDFRNFSTLYEFMTKIASILDIETLLNETIAAISDSIKPSRAAIMLLNSKGELIPQAIFKKDSKGDSDIDIAVSKTMTERVMQSGKSLLSSEQVDHALFRETTSVAKYNVNSLMCAPLKIKDKVQGIMYADRIGISPALTEVELKLFTAIGMQLSIALETARLYEELMNAMEFSTSIIKSLNSGVVVLDLDGKVIKINESALATLKIELTEVIKKPITEHKNLKALSDLMIETLKTGIPMDRKEAVVAVKGARTPLGLSISILEDYEGTMTGVIANFRDLTNIKKMEAEMKRSQKLAALGQMATTVAHEIRNPLNSIRGFAQLLEEKSEGAEGDTKEYLSIIIEEVDRMNNIVQDILDFSRFKEIPMSNVELNPILEAVAFQIGGEAEKREIAITLELDGSIGEIYGNEDRLKQVFMNITQNAIQAMTEAGTVTIGSSIIHKEGASEDEIHVTIKDTGNGIAEEDLANIFDPFFTKKDTGTGLGLPICLKITEQHGGRIDVDSTLNVDTTFTVVLPYPTEQ